MKIIAKFTGCMGKLGEIIPPHHIHGWPNLVHLPTTKEVKGFLKLALVHIRGINFTTDQRIQKLCVWGPWNSTRTTSAKWHSWLSWFVRGLRTVSYNGAIMILTDWVVQETCRNSHSKLLRDIDHTAEDKKFRTKVIVTIQSTKTLLSFPGFLCINANFKQNVRLSDVFWKKQIYVFYMESYMSNSQKI